MTTANRGKYAESAVRKYLNSLNLQTLAWYRLPDAHAGSFTPSLADFIIINDGQPILLEVKEVAHDYRLPVGNFKLENRARMRLFQEAGCRCEVLIYHSTTKKWRRQPLDYFSTLDSGSWDFRETLELTLKEAITLCFQS